MDSAFLEDLRGKIKENEKKKKTKKQNKTKQKKFSDLARELKKLWNMKMMVIPILIVAFGTVTKGLKRDLK